MNLSEMRQILAERQIQLTKSLGQCFLHDGNQLRHIVATANLRQGDRVLEIGPGLGPLTELLLDQGVRVTAIEKDARFVEILRRRLGDHPALRLLHEDALDHVRKVSVWRDWKVVSNLPYSIGSPLLVELSLAAHPPDELVVTLQHEVVKRLLARHSTKEYGLLTLLVGLSYQPVEHFKIGPACFFPEPEVSSGCVRLVRHSARPDDAGLRRCFVTLVKLGFSRRRKMMMRLLKARWSEKAIRDAYTIVGLDERVRAEAVSRDQFLEFAKRLLVGDE